ncbi:MAG: hypothetical protein J6D09_00430 [Clostridia bacterium]|nr:hypothetical protein [Clostridia bacterium]
MKKTIKTISIILCAIMFVTLFTACGKLSEKDVIGVWMSPEEDREDYFVTLSIEENGKCSMLILDMNTAAMESDDGTWEIKDNTLICVFSDVTMELTYEQGKLITTNGKILTKSDK